MSKSKWEAVFVGDKYHDAWAFYDQNGNPKLPSIWYHSQAAANHVLGIKGDCVCEWCVDGYTPCEGCGSEEMDEIMSPNCKELCTDCTGETEWEEA